MMKGLVEAIVTANKEAVTQCLCGRYHGPQRFERAMESPRGTYLDFRRNWENPNDSLKNKNNTHGGIRSLGIPEQAREDTPNPNDSLKNKNNTHGGIV